MSILVDSKNIKDIGQFVKDLTVQEVVKAEKYGRGKTIKLYEKNGEFIRVPYWYGLQMGADFPIKPKRHFNFEGTLRPQQEETIVETLNYLKDYKTVLLHLFPGFGKTILGAYHSQKLGKLTIVVMTITQLLEQWYQTFTNFTNARVVILKNVTQLKKLNFNKIDVIICMNSMISKIPKNIRDDIGTLIIDEAHTFCTEKRIKDLMILEPAYIIMETATPEKVNGMDKMLYKIVGNHKIYKSCNKTLSIIKYSTNISIKTYTRKLTSEIDYVTTVKKSCSLEDRNVQLINLIKYFKDRKIIILTSFIEHIEKYIVPELTEIKEDFSVLYSDKKDFKDARILIGTVGKMGIGFDPSSSCIDFSGIHYDLVILAVSFKNKACLTQYVGRGLRSDDPIVIHMVDKNPLFQNHWKFAGKNFYTPETEYASIYELNDKLLESGKIISYGNAGKMKWNNSDISDIIDIDFRGFNK
jgi:superfamily II DNA or RNA helicase